MPLTLSIRNVSQLSNGSPVSLVLDRRGALIGRAATSDWCLPDPSMHISSRHCEVRFDGNDYLLIDHSTNGTFLYGHPSRLSAPHPIRPNDVFVIGGFEVVAALDDASVAAAAARNAQAAVPQWQGWAAAGGGDAAAAPMAPASGGAGGGSGWAAMPGEAPASAAPQGSGWGPAPTGAAAAPFAAPVADPNVASPWAAAAPPPAQPASAWSSAPAPAGPHTGEDIWGKLAASNVVDWARGGFGAAAPGPAVAPARVDAPAVAHNFAPPSVAAPQPPAAPTPPPPAPAVAAPPAPAPAPPPTAVGGADVLLTAAGLGAGQSSLAEPEILASAGALLRRLIAGMVVMLEARARAKSQMGAQGTNLEFDGNNPLKFARTPEQALLQLLNPPERGFMGADRAVEDAFKDLQAHQMATLKAMQGALRATLDRFSPTAIRARAEGGGLLKKIVPAARDAALWAAYEKEFQGVAMGSDEAFMDMFAKEFRKAYEEFAGRK